MHQLVWTTEDIERATQFVRTYCAVDNSSEEEEKSGYFAFYQGKSPKSVKNTRANVARGEFAATSAKVLRILRELVYNEEGDVWLRYYETNETNPIEAQRFRGKTNETIELESTGSAVGDMASQLVMAMAMVMEHNRGLMSTISDYHIKAVEEREQLTMAVLHGMALETSSGGAQLEEALKVLSPTLEQVGPKLADALLLWLGGGTALPEEPGPRIEAGVQRVMAAAQSLGQTITAHPEEFTMPRRQPLVALVVQLAPALGLQVIPLPPREVPPPNGSNGASP